MATLEPVEMRGHAGKDKYRASTDEGPLQHTHTAWNVMILPDDFTLYMAAGREGGREGHFCVPARYRNERDSINGDR